MGAIWQRKFRGKRAALHLPARRQNSLTISSRLQRQNHPLALGEGEFSGGLTGQSIFLDGTPLLNADGSSNFSGVTWNFALARRRRLYSGDAR
jgi:hypothetical protein